MNNGCICCTVRGDLIRILGRLMKRKHKFDHIIIETTGMADPGPVAQTFFMDEEMKDKLRLDAIITLVDAKHVLQHLDSDECNAQLAFADVVLLNKADLVSEQELAAVEQQVRELNKLARIHPTVQGELPIEQLLGIGAFDLETRAAEMPEFLQEELPFEWAGLYDLEPGRYTLNLKPGPDPTIDLVLGGPGLQERNLFDAWKRESILLYSSDPLFMKADTAMEAMNILYRLPVDPEQGAAATLTVGLPGRYVLFTQHLPEEFDMTLERDGVTQRPVEAYEYASPHEHDDTVGSVGVRLAGDLDPDRFEAWMVSLLRNRGTDIFRTKGVLSLAGDAKRFVFQGVHMLFDGQSGREWEADTERESQLVFIGRDLDRTALTEGLRACLA
jgi:G3E family GTPase